MTERGFEPERRLTAGGEDIVRELAKASSFSDRNVRETSLLDAMNSGLFQALRSGGLPEETHTGGCVSYERRPRTAALLKEGALFG